MLLYIFNINNLLVKKTYTYRLGYETLIMYQKQCIGIKQATKGKLIIVLTRIELAKQGKYNENNFICN